MTLAVGYSSQVAANAGGAELNYWADLFTCTTTGTADTCWLYVSGWQVATEIKVILYNSSGNLIATVATFTSAQGTGWISKSCSQSVTASTQYALGWFPNTGYPTIGNADTDPWCNMQNSTGTYASPPASGLTYPGEDNGDQNVGRWSMYLDISGGGGGASIVPVIMRNYGNMGVL